MKNSPQWKLSSRMTLALSEADKEMIEKAYVFSKPLMERIVEILTKDLEKSIKEGDDFSKFLTPNWELSQAYLSGQREAIRAIINLLKIKQGRP